MKLYEITAQHKELLALADESEDMAESVKDTMDMLEGNFNDKAISLIYVHENMTGDVEAIKSQIERLTARKKAIENQQARMKEYLRTNMEASGIKKITCPIFTITLKNGRDIVSIDDESKIHSDYLNIETTMVPMKREILTALKNHFLVEGASIVKSKSSISIK